MDTSLNSSQLAMTNYSLAPPLLRSVNYDPFKQVAAVRSLLFPGYTFYYAGQEATWGALYFGDGVRNNDLIFML